jgi:hypothetical protein
VRVIDGTNLCWIGWVSPLATAEVSLKWEDGAQIENFNPLKYIEIYIHIYIYI